MINDASKASNEISRALHEANGGLHNTSLALQLLGEASPSGSPAQCQAFVDAANRGLNTTRKALLKLADLLPRDTT